MVTRGTTNPNRLRRCGRWLIAQHGASLGRAGRAMIVDLGYGASPVTTLELAARLSRAPALARARLRVLGLEIDPDRVSSAREMLRRGPQHPAWPAGLACGRTRIGFARGGFEIPLPAGEDGADVIRAFNVLRQYDESHVAAAWEAMRARLRPGGIVIDGTCDELGRRMTWVTLDARGPVSLSIAVAFRAILAPSDVAERLPKALIHRNVPGERVHDLLSAWDDAWARAAGLAAFGVRQRFIAAAAGLRQGGWPVLGGPSRWRQGELTVAWEAVRPRT